MTMDFRNELNGKEKVAQSLIGMESTGTPIVVNGQRADVILANEKKAKFNTQVDEYIDKFEIIQKYEQEKYINIIIKCT